jgi:hypothetical protein
MARDNYLYRGGVGGVTDADFGMDALADNGVGAGGGAAAAASGTAGSLKTGIVSVLKAEALSTTNKESMPVGTVTGVKREREE